MAQEACKVFYAVANIWLIVFSGFVSQEGWKPK